MNTLKEGLEQSPAEAIAEVIDKKNQEIATKKISMICDG
jgi:hypothetical protein